MSAPARVWVDHMARQAEGIMRGLRCLSGGEVMSYEEVSALCPASLLYPEAPQARSREGRLRRHGWSFVPVPDRRGHETEATPLVWGEAKWLAIPPEGRPEASQVFPRRAAAVQWAWEVAGTSGRLAGTGGAA